MIPFFVSAVLTICILAALVHFDLPKVGILRRIETSDSLSRNIVLTLLVGSFVIAMIFFLMLVLVVHFHRMTVVSDPFLYLISTDSFRNIVLGFIFAGVFIHWVSEFHRLGQLNAPPPSSPPQSSFESIPQSRNPPQVNLPAPNPPEATNSERLDTIGHVPHFPNPQALPGPLQSLPDLRLHDPKKSKILIFEGYLLLALFIFGSSDIVENFLGRLSTVKAGTGGLELSLSPSAGTSTVNGQPELASEIVSDKTSTEGGHPVGNSDVPGLGFLSDISRMIDVDERYLKLYLGDRDDQIASNSGDDRELKDLAAQFIAPLAECQTELWRSTGTNPLSSRSYWVLLEPTHEFSKLVKYKASGSISDEVILKMATAYSVMASETIKDVFVIRKEIRDASTLSDPSKEGPDEYDTLSKKCETLSKIVCVGGKLYEPTNLSMDQPELFRRGGSLLCTHDSDVEITAVTSSEEHDDHLSVPNLIRQRVYRLLKQSYVKGEWDGRPYAALIAACISSILSQDEAAVEEIDDWLQDRSEQNWYDLRMRTVRAALTEYWMTSDLIVGSNASLEDFHIAQLGQIVWDLMKIPDYEASKDNYWHAAGKAPSLDVEEAYDGDQECRLPSKTKIKTDEDRRKEDLATLKYTQITYMMKYIDRAYKEHNFDQGNRVEYVEQMLKELNEVDLGCLSHYYPSVNSPELHEKIAWTRADIYRLNALWKSYEYKDTVRTLNPDDKRKRLSAALQAATAGLRVLEPEIKDETEHRTGRGLAEKIKPSEIRQEYVKLKLLADRVAQDVSALSPG